MEEHFITIKNLVSNQLYSLDDFASNYWDTAWKRVGALPPERSRVFSYIFKYFGEAHLDHRSVRKKSPHWTISCRFWFEFVLANLSWQILALIPSGIELQNIVFKSSFWDEVPMQIIVSNLVVFPAGCMSLSNYSPRESLLDQFCSSHPYSLPGSGAVSVSEGV